MTKHSDLIGTMLFCFILLLRSCWARNLFDNLDLSTQTLMPTITGFKLTGNAADNEFGYSVSSAGDINKDGYDDIIVGARYHNNRGAAYVIYGGEQSSFSNLDFSTTTSLDPLTTGFMITGNADIDLLGYSVGTAGDIDNDGYDDIIVGAVGKYYWQGAVYVIYGGDKSTMSNIDLSTQTLIPGSTGFKITGRVVGDSLGQSVSTAGDTNKDGYDDIIVGAAGENSSQGAVYVIYGGPRPSMTNWDFSSGATLIPSTTGFMITGNSVNNWFGYSVSTAGDIDNDGYDDVIVGANQKNNYQGAAYVIYGGENYLMSNIDLSSTTLNPGSNGFMITGNSAGDNFGVSVSTAGDINKDGYHDIIIGASIKNTAYVIYGGPKYSMSNWDFSSGAVLTPSTTGFTITGNSGSFGISVSKAGDLNTDEYSDIIVGAWEKDSNQGAAYVIYGGAKSSLTNLDLSTTPLNPSTTGFMMTGNAVGDYFGFSVSTAGDINKDGLPDIIVGAYAKDSNQGAAYVIYTSCSIDCKQCSSESVCTQCKNSYLMYQSECFASCPDGAFATSSTCESCSDHCKHCSSASVCTECQSPYILYQDKCIASCPDGMFLSSTNTCESCSTHCSHCSSNSVCTECQSSFLLYQSKCFALCPDATLQTSSTICEDCPAHCNKCSSTSACTECKSSFLLYQSECFASCPDTTFATSSTCENCSDHCKHCSSASVCTECQSPYILYQDKCLASCPDGMFLSSTNTCESCPDHCKHCSSNSVCTECQSPYILYQSQCLDSCPDGMFLSSTNTCEACPAHCNHCTSASICTECQSTYILYQSQCLDSCPDRMFLSSTNTCEACPIHCNHCTSPSLCTECLSPFVLYDSQCLTSCPNAMFNSNNICKNCPAYCSSCTSQGSCQVCYQGYTLSNSLCVLSRAQEKASQAIASATQGIGSVISVGSAVFPLSALVSKIVQNTRYLNLSVTDELAQVYQSWQTDIISWDVPNLMSDLDHFENAPPLFYQYDLGSPFLVNFWPTLINVGIGFGAFIPCIILQKLFEHEKYEGWAYSLVLKLVAGSFNFALVQAYACLDDILFYLVLDAKTNPFNSFFSWSSMVCAVVFLALGCLQVFFNCWIVYKYQSIKNKGKKEIEAFNERNKYWELFYSDFNDNDLWSQSFFAILIIRSGISSLAVTILYDFPLMQTSFLVIMDIAILSFLYSKTPFNTLRGKLAQYYYEIITLLVHLCAFILAFQDTFEKSSDTVRMIMSTGILYLNTALISGAIGFMFIEIYERIRLKNKAPKRKNVPQDNQRLTQIVTSKTDISKRQEDSIIKQENKLYFFPENVQKRNLADYDFESNFHNEDSILSDMNLMNNQRNQSLGPIMSRYRPARNQRQKRNNPRNPSYRINYK